MARGAKQADREKESTRTRVIELLRRGESTVDELAHTLGVTDNAIRLHLTGLERAGIVRARGVRRSGGAGKPAVIYEIAAEAEPLFSKAYAPVLTTLALVLAERIGQDQLVEIMREVGRRIAAGLTPPTGPLHEKVQAIGITLDSLGAVTTVESENDSTWLRGKGCPLSMATGRQPEVCRAVEELLSVLTNAAVTRHCSDGDRPNCCFHLAVKPPVPSPGRHPNV